MTIWKNPPKAKIYEALSAIADGRVKLLEGQNAEVASSDRSKTYSVEWSEDLSAFKSNDNASYWQGYMGYPIIAVLMLLGRLDFSPESAHLLAGIPWKQLNKRFRNDYAKAVDYVLDDMEATRRGAREMVVAEVDRIMAQIEALELEKLPRRRRPAK
jgi:hypothetical protein